MTSTACCPGPRDPAGTALSPGSARPSVTPTDPSPGSLVHLIELPGGDFWMGSETSDVNAGDGEGPVRRVQVSPFAIGATAVTNAEFAAFVEATGYITGAERFGWSFVFAGFLPADLRAGAARPPNTPWWCRVDGATWANPEGPVSSVEDRLDHPVVHVDHDDARAFSTWAGLRLPTEAEWEYAARGGLEQARYAWGDDLTPDGVHRCNIWQGDFPARNDIEDGWAGTAPADSFEPNGFGLFNVAGNAWEWCADWWSVDHDPVPLVDPQGPAVGTARSMRGGSHLCHRSYCNRYRVSARTSNHADSAAGNVGFRCARSL